MDELPERLRRFVRSRVASRHDAEDVIQEVVPTGNGVEHAGNASRALRQTIQGFALGVPVSCEL